MRETFHHYHLARELAKKHSHSTYLASPIDEPESQVVLTVFASSLFHFSHERESLLKKAQRIEQFQHPHLLPILDMGIEEEQPFVVRQYLPNGSLRHRLKQIFSDRMPLRDALTLVSEVGEALAYAHEHNIFHGNIKPENILFDANDQIILTDFYLVGRKGAIIRDQVAEEYAFCYLAPEQFARTHDAKSDQYALGCLAYELITGRVPFATQTLASMMGQPNQALPVPLSESVGDLPPSLEMVVFKALSKDPDERFFDFSLFLEVIRSVVSPPPAFPLLRIAKSRKGRGLDWNAITGRGDIPSSQDSDESHHSQLNHSPRKNRSISHPVQPGKVETVLSSIHNDPAKSVTLQSLEPSEAFSGAEDSIEESAVASAISNASIPGQVNTAQMEVISLSEVFTDTTSIMKQETDNVESVDQLAFSDVIIRGSTPFTGSLEGSSSESQLVLPSIDEEVELHESLVIGSSVNSVYGRSEDPTNKIASSLTSGTGRRGIRRYRRRILELVLLFSVIMAVISSVIWLSGILTSDTSLHTTEKRIQTGAIVTKNVPTVQVTTTVTYPSDQPTAIPTSQPSPSNTLSLQPSPPISGVVTPTAIATPTSYEAEAPNNTLGGSAEIGRCSNCSGGEKVTSMSNGGVLQFNNVSEKNAGNYILTLYYLNASSDRTLYISVNGGSASILTVPGTGDRTTIGTLTVVVMLNAGDNTIVFSNPSSAAPDIDRIVV